MSRILAIGVATLDIVNLVPDYPAEDAEVRAVGQRVARGGNATNSLVVLSRLGHACAWGGTLAETADAQPILEDLRIHAIDLQYCRRLAQGRNPTSYISLSQATGSRTIVHYRDLPEFGFEDFASIDLTAFDWVHFEGRNVDATREMLRRARRDAPDARLSVEIEKPRADIETLFPLADLLLFSRAFALAESHQAPLQLLDAVRGRAPSAELVCSWGDAGAVAQDPAGVRHISPAFRPARVIDTLGAGDTFNAGFIDARLRGLSTGPALEAACRLAGRKCGHQGFAEITRD